MGKRILDIVNDFAQWRGNPFTLAALVADVQRQICAEEAAASAGSEPPSEGE